MAWYKCKKKLWFLLFWAVLCPATASYGLLGAGDVVFDPAALTQQLIHYITMCSQYATQTQQYARQIQQLQNEYQHLQSLNYRADLSGLNDMRQVMNAATGLANNFAKVQSQFEEYYPDFGTYRTQNGLSYAQQALRWNKLNQQNALDILKTATKLQESMNRDQDSLRYLSDRSDTASGTKDLLQILNQLLVLQTKQLMQLEQILTATAKANAAYLAEHASRDAAESNRYQEQTTTRDTTNTSVVNPYLGRLH